LVILSFKQEKVKLKRTFYCSQLPDILKYAKEICKTFRKRYDDSKDKDGNAREFLQWAESLERLKKDVCALNKKCNVSASEVVENIRDALQKVEGSPQLRHIFKILYYKWGKFENEFEKHFGSFSKYLPKDDLLKPLPRGGQPANIIEQLRAHLPVCIRKKYKGEKIIELHPIYNFI